MYTLLHAIDHGLMITTVVIAFALLGIFAATLIAAAGIYRLICNFINWRRQRAGKIVPHRVIVFYIPDNYRSQTRNQGRIYDPSEVSHRSKQIG
jgi:hypothetical protein